MDKIRKNISDITHNNFRYLMTLENVHGMGFGLKRINGVKTLEPCLHVLVKNKIQKKYLTSNNIIPKTYMGIKTDVIHVGKIKHISNDIIPQKFRPLKGGCGISVNEEVGTLGCIVYKKIKNKKRFFILSNNHVLANMNRNPIGSSVIQPTFENAGEEGRDTVAYLDTFVPIDPFYPEDLANSKLPPINFMDAALAEIINQEYVSNEIYSIGNIEGVASPILNSSVKKVGLVTGLTRGTITTVDMLIKTEFIEDDPRNVVYEDQILAEMIADSGDSGSITLNDSDEAVGLNFAADLEEGHVIMSDIKRVLDYLNVNIYTEEA